MTDTREMSVREMMDEIRDTPNVQMTAYMEVAGMLRRQQIGRYEVEQVLLGVREMDADLPVELRRSVSVAEVCGWGARPRD